MNVLGVVLARAGSKGLPNKHLLTLQGRPVISYTLEHARAAGRLTRVVVSSDCPLVRRFGIANGFDAVERPADLATDTASVQDVMLHAVDQMKVQHKFDAEAVVVLYGNVPIRPAACIDRAIEMLESTGCDSVRSFIPVGKWHPGWMSRLKGDVVEAVVPGSIHRRQDLEPLFLHDGGVVAVTRASLERGRANRSDPHAFFGVDRRGFAVEPGDTVEIDSRRDLYIADGIMREAADRAEQDREDARLRRAS
ncbi:acylneuraminate cytidylyltransferase family protein [Humisphaera borealis]|uniref:Acylneuraminate cytidylyltransferase family protein n=1 Tax=Humisphaera borealis TaxID=2807512 RepID=A0A7M2WU53_9BACT|nr:acylneuraminate cytidylyltransferase family protein [Humisphaera borealis]QOV88979.1 acylneuraminate cytidylyltransferase family protein [Humisphaera borealis]